MHDVQIHTKLYVLVCSFLPQNGDLYFDATARPKTSQALYI